MPELPEVETTRRGIAPHVKGRRIESLVIRQRQLRWPIPGSLKRYLTGTQINDVGRRAKYLLLHCDNGSALLHLGMSGSLRVVPSAQPVMTHDHVDFQLSDGRSLRFNDPRRFGALLWAGRDPHQHPLLASLGPEPLSREFTGQHLHRRSRERRCAVKSFIMDAHQVVGVGNIYASEALYHAGIHPRRPAGRISAKRYELLAQCIREVLRDAIAAGGTTLRDFTADGIPGYFSQSLAAYGREGLPCLACDTPLRCEVIGQRASFFCPRCQR